VSVLVEKGVKFAKKVVILFDFEEFNFLRFGKFGLK